jgi:glucokinase
MQVRMSTPWQLGIDLGHTNLRIGAIRQGKVISSLRQPTRSDKEWGAVANQIVKMAQEIREGMNTAPSSAGVGVAGQCTFQGVVRAGPNLWWPDVDLRSFLSAALRLPVLVVNDTRAATYGEWRHGAGRGTNYLVCLFLGTGIGGGVVSGGRLLCGCGNTAGELGHIIVDKDGPRCGCGNRGCLESLASGRGIALRAREVVERDEAAGRRILELARGRAITSKMVTAAYREGDPLATSLIEDAAQALSNGIVSLVHAFNPCRVILGGGVISGLPELVDLMDKEVRSRAMGCVRESVSVRRSELEDDAGMIGAAMLSLSVLKGGDAPPPGEESLTPS